MFSRKQKVDGRNNGDSMNTLWLNYSEDNGDMTAVVKSDICNESMDVVEMMQRYEGDSSDEPEE